MHLGILYSERKMRKRQFERILNDLLKSNQEKEPNTKNLINDIKAY